MRIGFNPGKDKVRNREDFFHQIVVPVYIPNYEGYFKDGFHILKHCLESLLKTIHPKTYVTIINNGSHSDITQYLNDLQKKGKIQELINTTNIGKLNSILKGIAGQDFQFVTITDSDVLFLKDWQKETYSVFEKFPKTGAVCPTPSSKSLRSNTFNIWFDLLFSKSLHFTKVQNPLALKAFAESIGNIDFYNKNHLEKYLTVSHNYFRAVVGAGHFVTTYRKEVFENNKIRYSNFMIGGDSEEILLDIPVVKKGMWRLSTENNFAYHMGNVEEEWMSKILAEMESNTFFPEKEITLSNVKSSKISFFIKHKLFSKILRNKKIWHYFLKTKGLSKDQILNY